MVSFEHAMDNLVRAYFVELEAGVFKRGSIFLLRGLWLSALDAGRSTGKTVDDISNDVAWVLNDVLESRRRRFLHKFNFSYCDLRPIVEKCLCEACHIYPADVLHALHDLEPPKDVLVRFPPQDTIPEAIVNMLPFDPFLDMGACLSFLFPMGAGTGKRARFQLVGFANRCWRPADTSTEADVQEGPIKKRRSTVDMIKRGSSILHNSQQRANLQKDLYAHTQVLWRLYGAILAARIVPFIVHLMSVWRMARIAIRTLGKPLHAWMWCFLELFILCMLASYLSAYGNVMRLRVPIVTVKLHRSYVEAEYLRPGDYEHCDIETWKFDDNNDNGGVRKTYQVLGVERSLKQRRSKQD